MSFHQQRVVITGASRDFGRTLAIRSAQKGAEVFLSARSLEASRRVANEIRALGHERVHAFACDLSDAASIRRFADELAQSTDRVDVLINNGARWLEGPDILSASDEDVIDTIASGATGTVLMVKRLLPLLLASDHPDIVNMISAAGLPAHYRSTAHDAFYAAKSAQAGFADILSRRLRPGACASSRSTRRTSPTLTRCRRSGRVRRAVPVTSSQPTPSRSACSSLSGSPGTASSSRSTSSRFQTC